MGFYFLISSQMCRLFYINGGNRFPFFNNNFIYLWKIEFLCFYSFMCMYDCMYVYMNGWMLVCTCCSESSAPSSDRRCHPAGKIDRMSLPLLDVAMSLWYMSVALSRLSVVASNAYVVYGDIRRYRPRSPLMMTRLKNYRPSRPLPR